MQTYPAVDLQSHRAPLFDCSRRNFPAASERAQMDTLLLQAILWVGL